MKVLRTRLATDWPAPKNDLVDKLLRKIGSNPDYQPVLQRVSEWLVEFDSSGLPGREIGLDSDGKPVLSGPDDRNYGFWLDTNMTLSDFIGEEVDPSYFDTLWVRCRGQNAT